MTGYFDPSEFRGMAVIVTGAGGGIGRAICIKFAKLGANLVLVDSSHLNLQSTSDELSKMAGTSLPVPCDISNEGEVVNAIRAAISKFGHIDILINAAGISDVELTIAIIEQNTDRWEHVLSVNLKGTYFFSKKCAAEMINRNFGKIVNISSVSGLVASPRTTAYGPAKSGVNMLTKQFALKWAKYNINVNAIAPGFIRTNMLGKVLAERKTDRTALIKTIPQRRIGEPDDVANVAIFLTSKASTYITGETIVIDGGFTASGNF